MNLNKLLLYRTLTRNKKLGLLFVGYKAAKYVLGQYQKRRNAKSRIGSQNRIDQRQL